MAEIAGDEEQLWFQHPPAVTRTGDQVTRRRHLRLATPGDVLLDLVAHLFTAAEDGVDRTRLQPRPEHALEVLARESVDGVPEGLIHDPTAAVPVRFAAR